MHSRSPTSSICDATTQHCVTTTTNTQCGANGSTCTSCGTNLECSGGQCVCDSNSCSMGCCVGGSTGTCELFGAQSGASCGQGGATCGTCPMGQTCDGAGNCVCNSSSCPHGCCSGGPTGTCVDWGSQSPTSCGTAGATCTGCTNGLCDTNNGTCACDSNTCASGCCVGGTTGTCEGSSGQSFTSCGTGGATCGACGTNESCTSGACTCGGSSGCAGGTSCCVNAGVGSCVTLTNDPNNCGWCGHSCQGGTCANGLCGTVTLGQTTYKGTSGPAGLTLGGANLYFSEYVGSANNGYIETCPTTGCPGTTPTATVVYTDVGNAGLGQIFYDSVMNALYWGDGNQGRFYGYNLTSNSVLFQGSDGVVAGVATDSSYVYLADFSGLAFANKTTGGGFAHISSTLGYSQGVALDSSGNIWVAARNNDIVTTCTLGGCGAQWTWTGGPDFIAVVGSSTYVATQNSGLYRCASATDCSQGNATQLTTESPANFSNDGTYAYFGYGGAVQRCSLSTGCATPQNVGQATGNVLWTAVDSTWVYWLTDAGEIQKVAK